jgi:hypothetical protein
MGDKPKSSKVIVSAAAAVSEGIIATVKNA